MAKEKIPSWFPKVGDKRQRVAIYKVSMVAFHAAKHAYGQNGVDALKFEEFPDIVRQSYADCTVYFLMFPNHRADQFHAEWSMQKRLEGWHADVNHDPERKLTPTVGDWDKLNIATRTFLNIYTETIKRLIEHDMIPYSKGDKK